MLLSQEIVLSFTLKGEDKTIWRISDENRSGIQQSQQCNPILLMHFPDQGKWLAESRGPLLILTSLNSTPEKGSATRPFLAALEASSIRACCKRWSPAAGCTCEDPCLQVLHLSETAQRTVRAWHFCCDSSLATKRTAKKDVWKKKRSVLIPFHFVLSAATRHKEGLLLRIWNALMFSKADGKCASSASIQTVKEAQARLRKMIKLLP